MLDENALFEFECNLKLLGKFASKLHRVHPYAEAQQCKCLPFMISTVSMKLNVHNINVVVCEVKHCQREENTKSID